MHAPLDVVERCYAALVILNIDTTGKELVVTQNPEPKLDQTGRQRTDKESHEPLWSTQVVVTDDSGGEIIRIATAGEPPDVKVGEEVRVDGLIAIPWSGNGRSGIAFRADTVRACP